MKKRKRAGAEPGREQSRPASDEASGGSGVSAVEAEVGAAGEGAAASPAPATETASSGDLAAQDIGADDITPEEIAPAIADDAGLDVAADEAASGASPEAEEVSEGDRMPIEAEQGAPLAAADAAETLPVADGAAAGGSDDDDSGWEDAPTRELDLGTSEFAATWTDASDTLPNVESEPEGAEVVADAEAAEEGDALPTDEWRVESILESLLFATDRPLGVSDLKRLLAVKDSKVVTDALGALRDRRADSGIQLISVAGGWQLRTHPANGAWVAKLVAGRPQRLSRAMMETLAIVAYRQPITRPEIDEIRGVDCGPVLRTLLDRNLIRVIGKKEEVGRPMLYGTTPEFLKTFSLRDLTELPTLREFHELGADEKAQVDAKLPRPTGDAGADVAADGTPLRPATVELPQADPAEEDALFDELDRASEAAARATASAEEPAPEAPADSEPAAGGAGMGEP